MPTLLVIDSSPRAVSVSNRLTASFASQWKRRHPSGEVIHHNTTLEGVPYLDAATVEAFFTPAAELTSRQKEILAVSDRFIDELIAADVIAIGAPMWDLSIPASLKAWIDLIVREERTFVFTEDGVKSLLPPGKKVYVFSARGGAYPAGTRLHVLDYQEPYLRKILGLVGLADVQFIYAEHQSSDPAAAAESLARAERELAAITA
jgi:FMN-dependent NADH-azoreductase